MPSGDSAVKSVSELKKDVRKNLPGAGVCHLDEFWIRG